MQKHPKLNMANLISLRKKLAKEQNKLKSHNITLIKQEVDEHDVAAVLSRWTKIPVEKLTSSETEKLLAMESVKE